MLHQLRKLHRSLGGPALLGLVVLAWLSAALLPCAMAGHPAALHGSTQSPAHDCCPSPQRHMPKQPAPGLHCTTPGCEMQTLDQTQANPLQAPSPIALALIAVLFTLAWPRATPRDRKFIVLRGPPPHLHPTLAYCTLLI